MRFGKDFRFLIPYGVHLKHGAEMDTFVLLVLAQRISITIFFFFLFIFSLILLIQNPNGEKGVGIAAAERNNAEQNK